MATEQDQGRAAGGAHASGWRLRWRRHLGAPLHALARPFRRTIWVLSAALVGTLGLFGGTAYAYFSAGGSGSGAASVGSLSPVTVTGATPTTTLMPGGTADLALTVTNKNPFPVTMTSITAGTVPLTITGTPGCKVTNATVSVVPTTGLATTLAPGPNTVHIPSGAHMGTKSASACQHAAFLLPVKVTVRK